MALTDDLVAYWKLDGNANDSVGTNNGTVTGATVTTSGKIDSAYSFDGTNDYINCGNDSSLDPFRVGGNNLLSLSIWFKRDRTGHEALLHKGIHGTNGWSLGFGPDDRLRFTTTDVIDYYFGIYIKDKNWHHVVIVYDSSYDVSLYLDGTFISKTTYPSRGKTSSAYLYIGGDVYMYRGIIDEVGIWSRELTSAEASELYNSGSGLTYPFTTRNNFFSLSLGCEF